MRRFPRSLSVLLAVVLGLSLAACGDKDATDAGTDGKTGAGADADRPAKGRGTLSQDDFNARMFSAIEKAGSAHVAFETSAGGAKSGGEGEVKYGDELALRITMENPSGGASQEVMLIGETFYVNLGGKYMSMSLSSLEGMGMPNLSANLDPKVQSKVFGAAITSFEQKGEPETLDGVRATPYDVTIDPTKVPDTFGTAVTEPLKFTYFIGPDDLPRKMIFHDAKNGDFVATYTDWGAPVDIKAPATSEAMPGM